MPATASGAASRAYLFVLPYFIPFLAFLVVPVVLVDLAELQPGRAPRLGEVRRLRQLAGRSPSDTELTGSIKNTTIYVVEAIFLVFILALFLALLLNRYRKGSNIFKLALYVPLLAPAVLVGLVWQFVTNYDFGLFNLILTNASGIDRVNIFGERDAGAADDRARRGLARPRVLDAVLPREPAERPRRAPRRRARSTAPGLRSDSGASPSRCCARCCSSRW